MCSELLERQRFRVDGPIYRVSPRFSLVMNYVRESYLSMEACHKTKPTPRARFAIGLVVFQPLRRWWQVFDDVLDRRLTGASKWIVATPQCHAQIHVPVELSQSLSMGSNGQ